jgi:sarcosine oxidase
MAERFDVIVAGLGAMGSATLFHLARRGVKALGIDQFAPPHSNGSSHGETRVIREAYFEHPSYVPFVQRAYELWSELERLSGEHLYLQTGGLMIGRTGSAVLDGALRSAREHNLPHELLNSAEINDRFPGLHPDPYMSGVLEPRAGILFPEMCVAAHLQLATREGAHIRTNEKVHQWANDPNGLVVQTSHETYHAGKLVLASGPWIPTLLPKLRGLFQVERQVLLWFKALDHAEFTPEVFPIHLWEYEPEKMFYGFPDLGSGVKVAFHHQGDLTNPVTVDRTVHSSDVARMRELLARYLPNANGTFLRGTVCLYTNTPDGHFILDALPDNPNVIVASPCSGHGFKFASAVGEVLADMACGENPKLDLKLFSLARFETKNQLRTSAASEVP